MLGHLNAGEMQVKKKRVRRNFHRINLEGAIKHCISLRTIQRKKYNVKGSNSLSHIDENQKLTRFVAICHFVFHTEKRSETKQSQFGFVLNGCVRI